MVLAVTLFGTHLLGLGIFKIPRPSDLVHVWPLLIGNACVAFCLNLVMTWFLKHNSPVTVSLIGIVKDILIVLGGILLFSEPTSTLQLVGFSSQVVLIFIYSMMNLYPQGVPSKYCLNVGKMACCCKKAAQARNASGACTEQTFKSQK
eukprot:gnl/TRDRNA2_/TRDRNA2_175074_c0_seq2.p1 gnl/TRDRNA2_/TRDRNA2_175074_c0~~gnl/TRDRNA2_/TRDRNA2_175074_c0_seq2.p1  ORF type:complete len:165 (-),score=4.24 gnl/TRDRNA2_/TRDRNA2_175074_c0_seq2:3-446(-)